MHATYRMVNWDGDGEQLAIEMAERCGYPVEHDMGYPCPGSFGTKNGRHQCSDGNESACSRSSVGESRMTSAT